MPITDSSPFSGMFSGGGGGGGPAFGSLNLPGFNQAQPINGQNLSVSPQSVFSLLGQSQPQSLANSLGPLLSQVFGTQSNLLAPFFQQQTSQNVAQAQSNAMERGLTGSSIEQAGMQSAQTQGQGAFDQYLASQLNNLVPAYGSALSSDISNQSNWLQGMAGAVGQQYSNQISQQEFQQMLQANMDMANQANTAGLWGAGIGALGSIGGGMASHYSDIRLKEDLKPLGTYEGVPVYSFKYKQNNKIGLPRGKYIGCLGHEVMKSRPDCVDVEKGYLKVNYSRLLNKNGR